MNDKDLNAFLASVRRTRFVDYLDPLGETAQNAFERRLSWARVSQHDPAYADEARFLLDNAEDLRELLRRELEEDDWIEEADVGREWDNRAASPAGKMNRMRENDRITEIFQPDDLDMGSQKGGRGRSTPVPRGSTQGVGSGRSRTHEGAVARSVSAPSGASSAIGERSRSEFGRTATREARSEPRSSDTRLRDEPLRRAPTGTNRSGSFGGTDRGAQERIRSRPPQSVGRSPVAERSKHSPPPSRPVADFREPLPPPPNLSLNANQGLGAQLGRGAQKGDDEKTLQLKGDAVVAEVEFDDWDAPDDPVSSTGIMRLEDITAPPVQREIIGIDNTQTVARPLLRGNQAGSIQPVMVLNEVDTAPSAATRLRRPGESAVGAVPRVRASVQEPRRSRVPLLVMGALSMLGLGVLIVGGIALAPMIYTKTNGFTDLGLGQAVAQTPQPAPVAPSALVEPAPAPSLPPSGSAPLPDPPTPTDPEATGNGQRPPAQLPSKAKNAKNEAKAKNDGPQAPTPAPDSSARPLNIEGLWVGSTSSTRSFKLTVLGQTDENFEGTVEVQLEDGTFEALSITGKVDGAGVMSFKGQGASFTGKVNGRKATGTYNLPGKKPESWTAYGSR